MYPLTTTTARIDACDLYPDDRDRAARLLGLLGITEPNDEPISYERLLDTLGLDDALWCCQAEPDLAPIWRRYAVWCARQVQHLMTDQRSLDALDVAERHADGRASDEELAVARKAALDAALALSDVSDAVRAAASRVERVWRARDVILATGSASFVPPGITTDGRTVFTSDEAINLEWLSDAALAAAVSKAARAAWAARFAALDASDAALAAADAAWVVLDVAREATSEVALGATRHRQSAAFRRLVTNGTL